MVEGISSEPLMVSFKGSFDGVYKVPAYIFVVPCADVLVLTLVGA